MTDTEWIAKLDADFGKLQRNRQQVPLEKLETTYAKSYKALISRLTEAADWFADRYLQTLAPEGHRRERMAGAEGRSHHRGRKPGRRAAGQMEAGPGGPPRPGRIRAAGLRAIRPM